MLRLERNFPITAMLAFAATVVGNLSPVWAAKATECRCYRSLVSPVLDGRIEGDPGWKNIPGMTGFFRLGGGYTEVKQTTVFTTWDEDSLYVGMVCEEPDMGAIIGERGEGEDLWLDNSVEIFVYPKDSLRVLQFIANTAGSRRGGEGNPGSTEWRAAAHKDADSWSIELRFPFSVLGRKPRPEEEWTAAFCRNIFVTTSGGDQFTSLCPLQNRFLEPENYSKLVFQDKSLDAGQKAGEEARLNADYRGHLTGQLEAVAKDVVEYKEILDRATRDKEFETKANALQEEARTIERLHGQTQTAPLPELRLAARDSRSLRTQLYDLKYKFLLKQLFE